MHENDNYVLVSEIPTYTGGSVRVYAHRMISFTQDCGALVLEDDYEEHERFHENVMLHDMDA